MESRDRPQALPERVNRAKKKSKRETAKRKASKAQSEER